jgi:hypothetical protein
MVIICDKEQKTCQQQVFFGSLGGNSGISKGDYRRFGSGKAATMHPYGDAEADIRGGDEDRYESVAQTGTGIFKNAFADQWMTLMNQKTSGSALGSFNTSLTCMVSQPVP